MIHHKVFKFTLHCFKWSRHLGILPYRCVNTADGEGGAVDNNLCNQDEIPPETQSCFLLCPNECVMSEWGPWSKCPQVTSPLLLIT